MQAEMVAIPEFEGDEKVKSVVGSGFQVLDMAESVDMTGFQPIEGLTMGEWGVVSSNIQKL